MLLWHYFTGSVPSKPRKGAHKWLFYKIYSAGVLVVTQKILEAALISILRDGVVANRLELLFFGT